ncbi:MAG: DUF3099 domain-containing protein [Micromonosporaceae bacterium]|nr:DUF3099 domain-containing protein [Micromonosporaceae bacterium]
MKRDPRPALITDAERSQDDQLRMREIRYIVMMSFRAVCVLAAAILVGTRAPLLWLWIPICVVGMVLVPWLAVLLANDRPPRAKYRLANKFGHGEPEKPEPRRALPSVDPVRVIDPEP